MQNISLQDLQNLFSKERLNAYNSPKEHFDNFYFVGTLSPKIGLLEVIIRNKIDCILSKRNPNWIFTQDECLSQEISKLSKHQIISKQNLGFWVKMADLHHIHSQIFNLDFISTLDFQTYYAKNKNKINHLKLRDTQKAKALLYLIKIIRNRAFHFENLYKINKTYPRLNTKILLGNNPLYIAIAPDKIEVFLDDILRSFDKRLLEKA